MLGSGGLAPSTLTPENYAGGRPQRYYEWCLLERRAPTGWDGLCDERESRYEEARSLGSRNRRRQITGGELAILAVIVAALFLVFWSVNRALVSRGDLTKVRATEVQTGFVDTDHPIANMTARARHLRQLAASTHDSHVTNTLIRMADEEEADANRLEAEHREPGW